MLTQEEIDQCREAFERFDKDGSGTIDVWELKATLNGTPSRSRAPTPQGRKGVGLAVLRKRDGWWCWQLARGTVPGPAELEP